MKLSVIVPTRDTRVLTRECVASVVAGSPPDTELLVVDDASRDGTAADLARRFPAARVLRAENAGGFTASANRGLEAARGEVLLLLNSDTRLGDRGAGPLLEAFAAEPGLGIAGARLLYPDGTPQPNGGAEPGLAWFFALASGLPPLLGRLPGYRRLRPPRGSAAGPVAWVSGAALALRRQVWRQVGPLDARFRFYAQDLDLCLRAGDAGWGVRTVAAFRVVHHHGATIGRREGSVARREHPELLWGDLLRWAAKRRGPRWAAKARRALAWGALLRLAGRGLARPFAAARRREAWDAETRAYRAARAALRGLVGEETSPGPADSLPPVQLPDGSPPDGSPPDTRSATS